MPSRTKIIKNDIEINDKIIERMTPAMNTRQLDSFSILVNPFATNVVKVESKPIIPNEVKIDANDM